MAKPKLIGEKMETVRDVKDRKMQVLKTKWVDRPSACKECREKPRENGSSRCLACRQKHIAMIIGDKKLEQQKKKYLHGGKIQK